MFSAILEVEIGENSTVNKVNNVKSTNVIAQRQYDHKTKEFIIRLLRTVNMHQKPLSQKTQDVFMKLQDK